jgi:hypothetical protein
MNKIKFLILLFLVSLYSCKEDKYVYEPIEFPDYTTISDEDLLDFTQRETFKYFWNFAESNSGCARERYHADDPNHDAHTVATGGTGFGLMAILVGIERNFVTREQAVERLEKMFNFLENADRFHGAWPHWIDGTNGNVKPFGSDDNGGDLVETAYLAQGLITIKEYFKNGSVAEKEIAAQADRLWKGIEWEWYTQGQDALYWHWSPDYGFVKNFKLSGYNEVLITYVMAASSPDFGISKAAYTNGWASNGGIKSSQITYGYPLLVKHNGDQIYGGPLFWAHYSYLGLNPHGLSDDYVNYWDVNVNHAKVNYTYCVENPKNYKDYGEDCWGLTASYTRKADGGLGYSAHKPTNDLGVISPTAAISSIPYTPEESLKALHYFYLNKDKLLGPAGFYDSFSPEYNYWVSGTYLAIDQGPIIVMIENYRSGLLWDLFMQNADIQKGLDILGYTY